jgi:hypothetical protein
MPTCGGWIDCRDLGQVLSTKGRCRIRRRIGAMTTKKPRYESRVFDGVP